MTKGGLEPPKPPPLPTPLGIIAGFYGTCVHVHVFDTSVADTIDSTCKHTWLALAEKFALGGGSVAVPRSCRYMERSFIMTLP